MSRAAAGRVMVLAPRPGIGHSSRQPRPSHVMHVAGAAAHDLDSVAGQDVDGPATHVAGQHHGDAHAGQLRNDIRFASAAGRRRQCLFRYDLVLVIHVENGEALAMPEMLVNPGAIGR